MWMRLIQRVDEIRHVVNPHEAYGVVGNHDAATREFDYLAGVAVSDASDIPQGMLSWRIPAQTYAAFPCTLAKLMETYRHVYHTWLPRSQSQRGCALEFELYGEESIHGDPSSRMYAYVPVK